jgi:hypothetical protein
MKTQAFGHYFIGPRGHRGGCSCYSRALLFDEPLSTPERRLLMEKLLRGWGDTKGRGTLKMGRSWAGVCRKIPHNDSSALPRNLRICFCV